MSLNGGEGKRKENSKEMYRSSSYHRPRRRGRGRLSRRSPRARARPRATCGRRAALFSQRPTLTRRAPLEAMSTYPESRDTRVG